MLGSSEAFGIVFKRFIEFSNKVPDQFLYESTNDIPILFAKSYRNSSKFSYLSNPLSIASIKAYVTASLNWFDGHFSEVMRQNFIFEVNLKAI